MKKKYDVGILGVWFGCNYGSIATYYALSKTIESYGLKVLMIHRPWINKYDQKSMEMRHSLRFAREYYNISESLHISDMPLLNELCDTFLLGSDQIWNYGITKIFGHSYFLDFAEDSKRKIAYATSFGSANFQAPRSYAKKALQYMRRMNAISVREVNGVKVCNNTFGVRAVNVLDPVLMCDPSLLEELAEKSVIGKSTKEPYIATYILDPDPEKREALLFLAKKKKMKLVNMLDGWYNKFKANKEALNLEGVIENLQEEDWLYYFKHSEFVVTDSFHGTCMAILFKKPFIAIGNPGRGTSRFESLLGKLKLWNRYVANAAEILQRDELLENVDYDKVYEILNPEREKAREWLKEALFGEVKHQKAGLLMKLKGNFGITKSWVVFNLKVRVKPYVKKVLGR